MRGMRVVCVCVLGMRAAADLVGLDGDAFAHRLALGLVDEERVRFDVDLLFELQLPPRQRLCETEVTGVRGRSEGERSEKSGKG